MCSVGFVRKLPFWASWLNVSDHLYFTFSLLVHLSLYIVDWVGRCLLVPLKMDLMLPVSKLLIFWEKVETALSPLLHRRNTTYSHSPGASTNAPTAPNGVQLVPALGCYPQWRPWEVMGNMEGSETSEFLYNITAQEYSGEHERELGQRCYFLQYPRKLRELHLGLKRNAVMMKNGCWFLLIF